MEIADATQELLSYPPDFILRQLSLGLSLKVAMETLTNSILHHKIHILGGINRLVELDNRGMAQFMQDLDFSNSRFPPLNVH
jgi:hypothetical protein